MCVCSVQFVAFIFGMCINNTIWSEFQTAGYTSTNRNFTLRIWLFVHLVYALVSCLFVCVCMCICMRHICWFIRFCFNLFPMLYAKYWGIAQNSSWNESIAMASNIPKYPERWNTQFQWYIHNRYNDNRRHTHTNKFTRSTTHINTPGSHSFRNVKRKFTYCC